MSQIYTHVKHTHTHTSRYQFCCSMWRGIALRRCRSASADVGLYSDLANRCLSCKPPLSLASATAETAGNLIAAALCNREPKRTKNVDASHSSVRILLLAVPDSLSYRFSRSVGRTATKTNELSCVLGSTAFLELFITACGLRSTDTTVKGKGSPYSITERRVPELIPVLGSQPAGDVNHKPDGRLPLLSARPAVTPATV